MKNILIIGASSAIAQATAKLYAAQGCNLFLLGRDAEKLAIVAADLQVRGAKSVYCAAADLADSSQHQQLLDQVLAKFTNIDVALLAYGSLPTQVNCEEDAIALQQALTVNFTSAANFLMLLAKQFSQQRQGCIAAISSVAADRGRKNSYVYCSAKAGLSTFLEGLSYRLAEFNVTVLDIKPGPVATPMTAHMAANFLWTNADYVAQKIVQAINKRKRCIYVPSYWRLIMLMITSIPACLYQKLAARNPLL